MDVLSRRPAYGASFFRALSVGGVGRRGRRRKVARASWEPGACAADVARRYEVTRQQVDDWRGGAAGRVRRSAGGARRSLPRYAMTRPDGTGPLRLWQNAAANQLYVYPAHKDYGDEGGGRPLPRQHPLRPRHPRLLGLGPAVPRRGGDDPRRLPPRHQGAARAGEPHRAHGADGLPPLAAERPLPRRLLQRRRASGRLRAL